MRTEVMSASRDSRKRWLGVALAAMDTDSFMFVLGPTYASDPDGSPSAPAGLLGVDRGEQTPAAAKAAKDEGDGSASATGDDPARSVPESVTAKKRALSLSLDSDATVSLKKSPQAVARKAQRPAERKLTRKVPAVSVFAEVWENKDAFVKALVLYNTHGEYKRFGEYHVLETEMLASHKGSVTVLPVSECTSGLAGRYAAVVYVESNYDEPLPCTFIEDVFTGDAKVL